MLRADDCDCVAAAAAAKLFSLSTQLSHGLSQSSQCCCFTLAQTQAIQMGKYASANRSYTLINLTRLAVISTTAAAAAITTTTTVVTSFNIYYLPNALAALDRL